MSSEIIQVAIVEDDDEIRQTLGLIIDGSPGFTCKLLYSNGKEAFDSLPNQSVDVVLMDVEMPHMDGIECVGKLKVKQPDVDFIMLTIRNDDDAIFQSICAGASGYLLKDTPPSRLLEAIKEVHAGGSPMSSNIARRVVQSFHQLKPSPLSERETEILQLLSQGLNYRTAAERLFLSPHTVKTHIKNIYQKLQVNSRAEAVRKAIENKLI